MPVRLGELAARFGCELRGDPDTLIERVATLQEAGAGAISFLANPRYRRHLPGTRAAAVVLDASTVDDCPTNALIAANPYATYARIAQVLYAEAAGPSGRHPSAVIAADAAVDPTAWIGPNAYVGAGATIGARVQIGPNSVVLDRVVIGADTRLVAQVTLCAGVRLGERCLMHPGVVIGADGFGHAPDQGGYVKIPQVGAVLVGDDVEIGANSTIDRAAIGDTVIERGVKIDNQVQVGHNVKVGQHCLLVSQTGISGSTQLGDFVTLAGKVGVVGHIEIGSRSVVGGNSVVAKSLPEGSFVTGYPARPHRQWTEAQAALNRRPAFMKQLRKG